MQLETKLNLALSVRQRLGDGRTSGDVRKACPATAAARAYVGKVEVGVIEDIKEVRIELQSESLTQLEVFLGGEVEVDHVWTAQPCAPRIPKQVRAALSRSQSGDRECSLVKPAIESLMTRLGAAVRSLRGHIERKIIRVVNLIRAWRKRTCVGKVAAHQDIECFPTARSSDSRDAPASEHGLDHAGCGTAKTLSFAIWQFVDVADSELVSEVWGGGPPFCGDVVSVLHVTLVYVAVRRAKGFGEGVRSQNVEALGEPALNGGLQTVVEHTEPRDVQRQNRIQARPRSEIGPPLVKDSKAAWAHGACVGEVRVQRDQRLIQVRGFVVKQIVALAAHIPDPENPVLTELLFHRQVPLVNPRNPPHRVERGCADHPCSSHRPVGIRGI